MYFEPEMDPPVEMDDGHYVQLTPLEQWLAAYFYIFNFFGMGPPVLRNETRCKTALLKIYSMVVMVGYALLVFDDSCRFVLEGEDFASFLHRFKMDGLSYVFWNLSSLWNLMVMFVAVYYKPGLTTVFGLWSKLKLPDSKLARVETLVVRRIRIFLAISCSLVLYSAFAYFPKMSAKTGSDWRSIATRVLFYYPALAGSHCIFFFIFLCNILSNLMSIMNDHLLQQIALAKNRKNRHLLMDLRLFEENYRRIREILERMDRLIYPCLGVLIVGNPFSMIVISYFFIIDGKLGESYVRTSYEIVHHCVLGFMMIWIPAGVNEEACRPRATLGQIPLDELSWTQQNKMSSFTLSYVFALFGFKETS